MELGPVPVRFGGGVGFGRVNFAASTTSGDGGCRVSLYSEGNAVLFVLVLPMRPEGGFGFDGEASLAGVASGSSSSFSGRASGLVAGLVPSLRTPGDDRSRRPTICVGVLCEELLRSPAPPTLS
jgi:hypothetical protein